MSSKSFVIKENVYVVLLEYFDGKIEGLTKEKVKLLSKGKDPEGTNKEIPKVDPEALSVFKKIINKKKSSPDVYKAIQWVFPKWDKQKKEEELKKAFPDKSNIQVFMPYLAKLSLSCRIIISKK